MKKHKKKILYFLRHAKAMEREDFKDKDDSLRPLTDEGKKKFLKILKKAQKEKIKIKHSFHSPFLRTKETAKLVEEFFNIKSKSLPALAHGKPVEALYPLLVKAKNKTAFIGHEPELSELSLLLGLKAKIFKKGELRLIEVKIKKTKASFKQKRSILP